MRALVAGSVWGPTAQTSLAHVPPSPVAQNPTVCAIHFGPPVQFHSVVLVHDPALVPCCVPIAQASVGEKTMSESAASSGGAGTGCQLPFQRSIFSALLVSRPKIHMLVAEEPAMTGDEEVANELAPGTE